LAAPATEEQLERLRPYFAGEASPATGEIDMYCPMHADNNRSAQLNPRKGVWYCMAGCGGGTVAQLVESEGYWEPMEGRQLNGNHANGSVRKAPQPLPTTLDIRRWHEALMDDEDDSGSQLHRRRGIKRSIAIRFKLGWDGKRRVYTIPVFSARGRLWNVRRYNPDVPEGRRKIWGIRGHNAPRLFPALALVPYDEPIIVCGGEWDALITIQNGFRCVTRTAAEHVWKSEWNEYFANRVVYGCHDCDDMGDIANGKLRKEIEPIAAEYRTIQLPYPHTVKHGMDLTDFWIDGGKPNQFRKLLSEAT
jgi:hypothetical protein